MISRTTSLRGIRLVLVWLAAVAGWTSPGWGDVQQVLILAQRDASNGNTANTTYRQNFEVQGTDIAGVTVTPPVGSPFSLDLHGDGFGLTDAAHYGSLAALQAAYPQGNYTITITKSGGGTDTVTLPFDAEPPAAFAIPTLPLPLATDVPYSPVPAFTWNSMVGAGAALTCRLENAFGNRVVEEAPYGIGEIAWPPGVDLQPDTSYAFILGLANLSAGSTDRQTDGADPFTYYGVFVNQNTNQFTTITAVPEPGTAMLLIAGLTLLFGRRIRKSFQ